MGKYTLDSAMIRLKEVSELLEAGDHDLDMSMKLYEEGVRLVAFCNNALNNARQQIAELSNLEEEEVNE